jgi:hypothetical protein
MVEAFCAEHNHVTIDTVLYEWPASRFEKMYEAFAKRKIADDLNSRRNLEMSGIWANSAYEQAEDREARTKMLKAIDSSYSEQIWKLYNPQEIVDEIDPDDPFWQAMQRSIDRQKGEIDQLEEEDNG